MYPAGPGDEAPFFPGRFRLVCSPLCTSDSSYFPDSVNNICKEIGVSSFTKSYFCLLACQGSCFQGTCFQSKEMFEQAM